MVPIKNSNIVKDRIKKFIKDNFILSDKFSLKDDDSFMGKGIIDSTGILELVEFIQQEFSMKVEDEEIAPDNLDSLNKLTAFITVKTRN